MGKRSGSWLRWALLSVLVAASAGPAVSPARAQGAAGAVTIDGEVVATAELVAAAEREGRVVLYTGQGASDEQKVAQAFMKRFPKVTVEVISSVGGKIHERMLTEAQAGKNQADVVIQTDLALMEELIAKGLLAEFAPPSRERYGNGVKHDGWWYAANTASMLISYNTNQVKKDEAPKSWRDLVDPKWKGRIGWNPVTIGGTTWGTVLFMRKEFGEDYLRKLAALGPKFYPSTSNMDLALAKGEVAVAISTDLTNYRLIREQGAPVEVVYPVEGVVRILYPMGVVKNSPHPNAGRLYAQWYLSKDGQNAIVRTRGGYSARADVEPAPGKPAPSRVKFWEPDRGEWIEKRAGWIADWQRVFGAR